MTHDLTPPRELVRLLTALLDGSLSTDEHAALLQAAAGDARAQHDYLDLVEMHAMLSWQYRAASVEIRPMPLHANNNASRRLIVVAIAAVLAGLCMIIGLRYLADRPSIRPVSRDQSVALLTNAQDAVFADADASLQLGSTLPPGRVQLTSGSAQFMLNSGAVVDLTGPCEFELTGTNGGFLKNGRLQVFVPDKARGFTLTTPGRVRMIDLGTEFASIVRPSGRVELHVLVGEVELRDANDRVLRHVTSGYAAAVEPDGRSGPIALNLSGLEPPRELVQQSPPKNLFKPARSKAQVVAGYQRDFATSTPTAGWRYLWNAPRDWDASASRNFADGAIWDAGSYRPLKPAGDLWTADGDRDGTNHAPALFMRLAASWGHPGLGAQQTMLPEPGATMDRANHVDRYVIAAWTVDRDGFYAVTDSSIRLTNPDKQGNGVKVRVFTSYSVIRPALSVLAAGASSTSFDTDLGYLKHGQMIYIAVGPNGNYNADAFAFDFDITCIAARSEGVEPADVVHVETEGERAGEKNP
ncbi:MAG: hypothetical protein GC162_13325 [Planctomycetes bacterium]|nr:hypothetical protein [Planctomycetota bacterium]